MNRKGYVLTFASLAFLIAIIMSFSINPEDFSGRTEFAGKTTIKIMDLMIKSQDMMIQKDKEVLESYKEINNAYVLECGIEEIYARWDYERCYPSDENVGNKIAYEIANKDASMEYKYINGKITGRGNEITLKDGKIEYKFMPYTSFNLENKFKIIANEIVTARECIFNEIAKLTPDELDKTNVINKNCFKEPEKWFAYYNFEKKDIFFEYGIENKVLFVIAKEKIPSITEWQKNAINIFETN